MSITANASISNGCTSLDWKFDVHIEVYIDVYISLKYLEYICKICVFYYIAQTGQYPAHVRGGCQNFDGLVCQKIDAILVYLFKCLFKFAYQFSFDLCEESDSVLKPRHTC